MIHTLIVTSINLGYRLQVRSGFRRHLKHVGRLTLHSTFQAFGDKNFFSLDVPRKFPYFYMVHIKAASMALLFVQNAPCFKLWPIYYFHALKAHFHTLRLSIHGYISDTHAFISLFCNYHLWASNLNCTTSA